MKSIIEEMMINFEALLKSLADYLVSLGVPAEYGQLAALGIVFLAATLIVLLLARLLLGLRKKPASEQAEQVPEPTAEAPIEEEGEVAESAPEGAEQVRPEVAEEGSGQAPAVSVEEVVEREPEEAAEPVSLFQRLRQGLSKTRSSLLGRVDALFDGYADLDDAFVEELEEILITADFGMQATQELVQALTKRLQGTTSGDAGTLRNYLKEEIRSRLECDDSDWLPLDKQPVVLMVVGVNGVGKTTTIGKLAKQFSDRGKKVVLGAGDTFRAAAAEQLQVWGERSGAEVIRQAEGSDPAAVAFDAAKAALARKADLLILDTAGRLHTKVNLMEELKKVRRVLDREIPGAPHETLLVLDATTGQNALTQAKMFQEAVEVSGIALTKLDGTAKGGIVVAISTQLGLPVRFVGVGEGVSDLRAFEADEFVDALFAET